MGNTTTEFLSQVWKQWEDLSMILGTTQHHRRGRQRGKWREKTNDKRVHTREKGARKKQNITDKRGKTNEDRIELR
jgi:hypothetical protein